MKVHIEECKGIRRASACIRDAGIIWVKVPRHWAKDVKHEVIRRLVDKIERKDSREKSLLAKQAAKQERVTIRTREELEAYVRRINAETFNVPLGKVRMGYSRYNHLAQVNLRTKTMTVSKYCLEHAPAEALRYLIVHELAHYFVAGHGPDFWALVGKHVPDYRLQSRIIKAFHHQTVIQASAGDDRLHEEEDTEPDGQPFEQPAGLDAPPKKTSRASRPTAARKPAIPEKPATQTRKKPAGPFGPGWFQQLLLWGER
jgi:predicted SprT family Zn-dependent metalloprotease